MTDKVIFDLIINSKSSLTLVKANGNIVLTSRVFDNFISDRLPYESNLLEMLMHTEDIVQEIHNMYSVNNIDCSVFPQEVTLYNGEIIKLSCQSTFELNNDTVFLIEFSNKSEIIDNFTAQLINSENLFVKKKEALIVYDSIRGKVVSINNYANNYLINIGIDTNRLPNNITKCIDDIVENAKVGGIASKTYNLSFPNKEAVIRFECVGIDSNNNYKLVSFVDNTNVMLSNDIGNLDKERAHNIIDVVPGILFEFELEGKEFKFTYISEGIKSLIGLSSKHVMNNSIKLFSHLNKHDRARLHFFFTSLTEDERKSRNEFKIVDHNNNQRWITIDWQEKHSTDGLIKGTGYIDDITDKKKIQIQKREIIRRKELKEYFSVNLLKQSSIPLLLEELAKLIVVKLNLQDVIIYIYNSDSKNLEYATSYSSLNSEGMRVTFPKEISSSKGIIGRVVNSQKSEIINNSSDDADYYSFDSPSESEITVPIIFEGELLGVIDSEHVNPNFFSNEHMYLLEDIAETLAVRLVQKKRQNDNLKFHSTLSLLYNQGKIFDFNFDVKTKKFNDSCIDNIISLVGIDDTSKKITIYNDSKILLDYILQYDVDILTQLEESLEKSVVDTKKLTFRIITEQGFIKWLKITVSNVDRDDFDEISSISGTIQDVTKLKELETKSEGLKELQTSIKICNKQLNKNGDILQSLDIIANAISVSEIVISKVDKSKAHKLSSTAMWHKDEGVLDRVIEECFITEIDDFKEVLKSNMIVETSTLTNYGDVKSLLNSRKINSFLSVPIKTSNGLWGTITYIVKSKSRKWQGYEKDSLIIFSNVLSVYVEDFYKHKKRV